MRDPFEILRQSHPLVWRAVQSLAAGYLVSWLVSLVGAEGAERVLLGAGAAVGAWLLLRSASRDDDSDDDKDDERLLR